jgi:REP element-mobilizing transposase RayT
MGEEGQSMGDTWHELLYHIVWATKYREPTITPAIERHLHALMVLQAASLGCYTYACNGVDDHVHMALNIPPQLSVSHVVGQIKGASAHQINNDERRENRKTLRWQRGFGASTYARKDLPWVINYINNQKAHHKRDSTDKSLEQCD